MAGRAEGIRVDAFRIGFARYAQVGLEGLAAFPQAISASPGRLRVTFTRVVRFARGFVVPRISDLAPASTPLLTTRIAFCAGASALRRRAVHWIGHGASVSMCFSAAADDGADITRLHVLREWLRVERAQAQPAQWVVIHILQGWLLAMP